jgi:hypothetical protein
MTWRFPFFDFPMRAIGFFVAAGRFGVAQALFFWNDYGKPEKQIRFSR